MTAKTVDRAADGAQVSAITQLQREPQPVVRAPTGVDELAVSGVEMEIAV